MTLPTRNTRSATQKVFQPTDRVSTEKLSSHQEPTHGFLDLFFDPDPRISKWERYFGGLALGFPFLFLVNCSDSSGFRNHVKNGDNNLETPDAGTGCVDNDGDGFYAGDCGTCESGEDCAEPDCDDNNDAVFPGAREVCDYEDNDCNGETDEGDIQGTFYADRDGDGYGDPNSTSGCNLPLGMLEGGIAVVDKSGDCNDNSNAVHPGVTEICNAVDDDCDGMTDEEAAPIGGEVEICDGVDNNCDGLVDGWQIKYNGSANESDEGNGIVVDAEGNILVTGFETVTGEGQNIWIRKMNQNGEEIWSATFNDPINGTDVGSDITVDSNGDVYVTGYKIVTVGVADIWIRKLASADGTEIWTTTYNGPSNGSDEGLGIALGPSESLYVTGDTRVEGVAVGIWLHKYSSVDGRELWSDPIVHNSGPSRVDMGHDVTVDPYGNPYVIGFVTLSSGDRSIWINKYDPDGVSQNPWPVMYNGYPLGAEGYGIIVDLTGAVYMTGFARTSVAGLQDVVINKYDPNGNPLWADPVTYNNVAANGIDVGSAIALDRSGNIYVVGSETVLEQGYNLWVNSYDANGNPRWLTPISYNGPTNSDDRGFDIAIDDLGNVYVTGFETVTGHLHDILIQKYLNCSEP